MKRKHKEWITIKDTFLEDKIDGFNVYGRVCLSLMFFHSGEKGAFVSVDTIAEVAKCGKRSAIRELKRLEADGVITKKRTGGYSVYRFAVNNKGGFIGGEVRDSAPQEVPTLAHQKPHQKCQPVSPEVPTLVTRSAKPPKGHTVKNSLRSLNKNSMEESDLGRPDVSSLFSIKNVGDKTQPNPQELIHSFEQTMSPSDREKYEELLKSRGP